MPDPFEGGPKPVFRAEVAAHVPRLFDGLCAVLRDLDICCRCNPVELYDKLLGRVFKAEAETARNTRLDLISWWSTRPATEVPEWPFDRVRWGREMLR